MVIPENCLELDSVTSDTASLDTAGHFFLVLTKGSPWWQALKKHGNEKAIEDVLEPLLQKYSQQTERVGSPALSTPGAAALVHQSKKYVYNCGGVAVCPGVVPVAAELLHVSPYVQHDEATQRIIVFFGWLSNLADLAGSDQDEEQAERGFSRSGRRGGGHQLPQTGYGDQTAHLTTRALLRLYDKLGAGQEMLMLSELQGQFAFAILDIAKKVVFAARDASGDEELFYAVGEDGSLMFTNTLASLPPETAKHAWQELMPGHYIAGKEPVPVQYALTRAELAARERRESNVNAPFDDDDPLQVCNSWDSSYGRESFSPRTGILKRLSNRWGA